MFGHRNGFTLELAPHCASVPPSDWPGDDHLARPLSEVGMRQARALVRTMGGDVAAIYSSPALRCLQTVGPLAGAAGLVVRRLPDLLDTQDFAEPKAWTGGVFAPMGQAIGGAWTAGLALRALDAMAADGGRVVASSHGDLIPVLLATLCAYYGADLPQVPDRGGWYTLTFGAAGLSIHTTQPSPGDGNASA